MRNLIRGTMAGWLAVILALVFWGPAQAQGEKKIKIGVINPMTGPAAPWGLAAQCSMERFKILFNDRQGGITVKGQKYKFEMIYADDKYTVAGGRAAG